MAQRIEDYDESRRPGLKAQARKLKQQHPDWPDVKCITEAKAAYIERKKNGKN